MAALSLTSVLDEPDAAIRVLEGISCVETAAIRRVSNDEVVFQLVLLPDDATGAFIREGYPVEKMQIVVKRSGDIRAVPKSGSGRSWLHRNSISDVRLDLCLWDPGDPDSIRWDWDDGLEEYVRIVSRHLIYEEYYRRHNVWPVEDSPHGSSPTGSWQIRSPEMRKAARRWKRE